MPTTEIANYGGKQTLKSNVIDVTLILLGALLLPIYFAIYMYDELIFNMLQCTHVMVVSLYAVLYINFIKKECFGADELRYRAFNMTCIYTMFVFFLMFVLYIIRIVLGQRR